MTAYSRDRNLTPDEMKWYARQFTDLEPTGEVIRERWGDGSQGTVVFRGSWTPSGCIRDCGDHYIKALYHRYDRISKDLQTVTLDVEDR